MTNKRRLAFRIFLALSVLGSLAIAICLGAALSSLSAGPNSVGYDLLLVGMQSLPYLAAIVVLAVIVRSIGARVRFAVGGLALASGVFAGLAAGLVGLGSTLASIEPLSQPVQLNSLLLAVWGVGGQIAPVAVILAAGAAVLAMGTWISRRATGMRTAASATAV